MITRDERLKQLAERVYELATTLWYRLMPDIGSGHPGVEGPTSEGPP